MFRYNKYQYFLYLASKLNLDKFEKLQASVSRHNSMF